MSCFYMKCNTGLKWVIQVRSKCQIDFSDETSNKRSGKEKLNITKEFYIFEIALVPNFSLIGQFLTF